MKLSGSTKPSFVIFVGGCASFHVGYQLGGWHWLFAIAIIISVIIDAGRVSIHEKEHNCG